QADRDPARADEERLALGGGVGDAVDVEDARAPLAAPEDGLAVDLVAVLGAHLPADHTCAPCARSAWERLSSTSSARGPSRASATPRPSSRTRAGRRPTSASSRRATAARSPSRAAR